MKVVERNFHGRKFVIETGRLAKQANGSVLVRYGDSMVIVTACTGSAKEGDFLPLTIDYVEKSYAGGKIPGSYFRREAKLGEKETLTSRLIDRPCRPLFPEGFNIEIQVVATVVSADGENDTDVLAVCGASAALTLSDIPFLGPIAAVRVVRSKGKLLINPSVSEARDADLNFVVAGTKDAIVMVEGGAAEATEQEVLDALFYAHKELQQIIAMQEELQKLSGKPKMEFEKKEVDASLVESVKSFIKKPLNDAIRVKEKLARRDVIKALKSQAIESLVKEDDPDFAKKAALIEKTFEEELYYAVRNMVFDEKRRIDGRDFSTVRPITVEAGSLPRGHGSALFTRGETQALVVATLGTKDDAQRMDSLVGETTKTFMLHYNFPAFSVGEVKPLRGPGRREVGHGALAERALRYVLPNEQEFPYVIRIVSEILESNGSSSMATVCGGSLSLMDAGVPIKGQVAGVAMGLMVDGKKSVVLTDILGDEDHLGDMDFKVCGTAKGITALQMDIKIQGLEKALVEQALAQAREARLFILEQMNAILPAARKQMSKYAPRIVTIKINPDKIRDLIGPGGKTIRSISDSCGVKIDVQDDGTVNVSCADEDKLQTALKIINGITEEAVVGKIYKGIIKRITDFGAFVEIIPGTEGLLHISQISDERIRRVTDVLNEGDDVVVKVLDVDRQGKIRLSRKEAMAEMGN
ncbi:MAG: polyribonucleotide nucleotidyltransferase [Bdellovibrionota bacterium]|nr:MAG: polyribonucleotide nucleotidyltransferase [Bdellovibrionota bacterium]